jgi:hypothetical protein
VLKAQLARHALPGFEVELLPSRLGEVAVPLGGVALALEGLFGLMIGPAERFRNGDEVAP